MGGPRYRGPGIGDIDRRYRGTPPILFGTRLARFGVTGRDRAGLYVFAHEAPKDLRTIGGTIEVILAAGKVNRTGIIACLTLGTIVYGEQEGLQKRPVVLPTQELSQPRDKQLEVPLLLLLILRFGKAERNHTIEIAYQSFFLLFGNPLPSRLLPYPVIGRW